MIVAIAILAVQHGHAATYFFDTFDSGATQWTVVNGTWAVCQPPGIVGYRYCQTSTDYLPPMSLAGDNRWADYYVQATVNLANDVSGRVAILGRVQDKYHFYELRLERDASGVKKWWIYKCVSNAFTALASGPFDYHAATDYVLRLSLTNTTLAASISTDNGATFHSLGIATDAQYRVGRIGLKTRSSAAQFAAVKVNSAGSTPSNTRRFGHIVLVTLENHSASEVLGSPYLAYFNSLAARFALAENFYANVHPSAPNYFVWTTGQFFFQNTPLPSGTNDVVKRLLASGKTWGAYFDQPSTETNVFQYLPEVAASATQLAKVTPIVPNFASAYSTGKLPQYVMVHANETSNGHACRGAQPCLATTDLWLQNTVQPYIDSAGFTANHDLLIVAWDEGNLLDDACAGPTTILLPPDVASAGAWTCGGHTVFLMIGPDVKPGYASSTVYHDESILRLMLEGLGVTSNLPGASSFATDMNEFFR